MLMKPTFTEIMQKSSFPPLPVLQHDAAPFRLADPSVALVLREECTCARCNQRLILHVEEVQRGALAAREYHRLKRRVNIKEFLDSL